MAAGEFLLRFATEFAGAEANRAVAETTAGEALPQAARLSTLARRPAGALDARLTGWVTADTDPSVAVLARPVTRPALTGRLVADLAGAGAAVLADTLLADPAAAAAVLAGLGLEVVRSTGLWALGQAATYLVTASAQPVAGLVLRASIDAATGARVVGMAGKGALGEATNL